MTEFRTIGFASCFLLSACLSSGQAFSQETTLLSRDVVDDPDGEKGRGQRVR